MLPLNPILDRVGEGNFLGRNCGVGRKVVHKGRDGGQAAPGLSPVHNPPPGDDRYDLDRAKMFKNCRREAVPHHLNTKNILKSFVQIFLKSIT